MSSALSAAFLSGNLSVVQFLLDNGAKLFRREYRAGKFLKILLEDGELTDTLVYMFKRDGDLSELLIEGGLTNWQMDLLFSILRRKEEIPEVMLYAADIVWYEWASESIKEYADRADSVFDIRSFVLTDMVLDPYEDDEVTDKTYYFMKTVNPKFGKYLDSSSRGNCCFECFVGQPELYLYNNYKGRETANKDEVLKMLEEAIRLDWQLEYDNKETQVYMKGLSLLAIIQGPRSSQAAFIQHGDLFVHLSRCYESHGEIAIDYNGYSYHDEYGLENKSSGYEKDDDDAVFLEDDRDEWENGLRNTSLYSPELAIRDMMVAVRPYLPEIAVESVEGLVKNGFYINSKDVRDMTPLKLAVVNNDINLVRKLLDLGTKNGMEYDRLLPLHYACNMGFYEMAKILIEHGANIEYGGYDGRHRESNLPISLAIKSGNLELVEFLLKSGARTKYIHSYRYSHRNIDILEEAKINPEMERLVRSYDGPERHWRQS